MWDCDGLDVVPVFATHQKSQEHCLGRRTEMVTVRLITRLGESVQTCRRVDGCLLTLPNTRFGE